MQIVAITLASLSALLQTGNTLEIPPAMRFRNLALLFCLTLTLPAARASETPTEHAANVAAAQEMAAAPPHGNLPDYSLPPDQLAKAQHLPPFA